MRQKIASYSYTVEPAEGNAQQEMPLTILIKQILECATFHAEEWSVGYSTLILENQAWVLARLAIEMKRMPLIGETFTIETWIEGNNKLFSARNFAFYDEKKTVIGYARSIWSVIDLNTRSLIDLSSFEYLDRYLSDKECPIAPQSRMRGITGETPYIYDVKCSDIDLNRHVNSVKYVEHILDLFTIQKYDNERIARFEITYMNEALFGNTLALHYKEIAQNIFETEMKNQADNIPICKAKICFAPRDNN